MAKSRYVRLPQETYDKLAELAGPGFDSPQAVIRRLVDKQLNWNLRLLVLFGAEYVYNHNWIGQCQSPHEREIMYKRQNHLRRYFVRKFGKVKGTNLLKKLEEDVHVPAEEDEI